MLRVGISEVNITPELGLPMSGMLRPPKATGVQWPLMGRAIVFDDGASCAAVVCLDLLDLMPHYDRELRQSLTAGTDLPAVNVLISCTHTHRGPMTHMTMDQPCNWAYLDLLQERLTVALRQALASRRPARVRVGAVEAPGWSFNRRPIYRTEMGEQVGTQGPHWIGDYVRNEGPEDNHLHALLVTGTDGIILGGLVNYACHPTVMGGVPVYSADYCGALTECLAGRHGGVFSFLEGAAGNLWCINSDTRRPPVEHGAEYATRMGAALADKFDDAVKAGVELSETRVRCARTTLRIPQRTPTPEQVALAKWYLEKATPDVDQRAFTRRIYGHPYTFFGNDAVVQDWFCRETIGMWEWQRRSGQREPAEDVEVSAIAVGDLAFVGFPAEYFTEFGLRTKASSPFARTLVAELANGNHGYVPTREAFDHGGYEPRLDYHSRLSPEAGDRMCDAAIAMLKELSQR